MRNFIKDLRKIQGANINLSSIIHVMKKVVYAWWGVAVIHMNVSFWIQTDLDIIFDEFPNDALLTD